MKKRVPFQMRSGNKPSPAKLLGVLSGKKKFKDSKLGKQLKEDTKQIKNTQVGKLVSGVTGSIFGSKTNPKYKGKGRSLFGSLADSRRRFKAKSQNKPTKSDGFGTALGGQEGVTIKG
tara:strand:- start:147 stop:500 length:354 start_codon:yes stop_codon:yes gene_type:complete